MYLINNDIVDKFQSAYKTGHRCETALLRVYILLLVEVMLLLGLAAAFDTIDHDNLFCILEKCRNSW